MLAVLPNLPKHGGPALRALVRTFGPAPEVVTLEAYKPGRPRPGHVRVRMIARSVNPSDLLTIAGAYPLRTTLPFVPGFEGVGVVEDVGPGVTDLRVGDRVLPMVAQARGRRSRSLRHAGVFRSPPNSPTRRRPPAKSTVAARLMLHERAALFPGITLAITRPDRPAAAFSSVWRMRQGSPGCPDSDGGLPKAPCRAGSPGGGGR
jgi:NADPH:quinone reductase-like Zn-dependent oxidoreductase